MVQLYSDVLTSWGEVNDTAASSCLEDGNERRFLPQSSMVMLVLCEQLHCPQQIVPSSECMSYVNLLRTGLVGQCPDLLAAWWMSLLRQKVEKNSSIVLTKPLFSFLDLRL